MEIINEEVEDNAGVAAAPPLYFLLPILTGALVEWVAPSSVIPSPWRWLAGGVLFVGGLALVVAGFRTQTLAGTDPLPGHPSTRVVTHGVYAFTRNPMYLGMLMASLGLVALFDSLWALGLLLVGLILIHPHVILWEERYLARKFGEEYLSYRQRVRRWI